MASLPPLKKPKTGPIGKSLGKAMSMFKGKESRKEEMKEANAVKSGRITPKQYAAGEKKEGHGAGAMKKGLALRAGKLSPSKYADGHNRANDLKYPGDGPKKPTMATKPTMASRAAANRAAKMKLKAETSGPNPAKLTQPAPAMKKGGCVKKYARGGGIEVRGKTKGRII